MNFENRVNNIVPGESVEQIAKAFFTHTWERHGYSLGSVIFVDDSSPTGTGVLEVAVVDQVRGKLESITVGWCKTLDQVVEYFRECLKPDAPVVNKNVRVPLKESDIVFVSLECGCCGQPFKDSYQRQKKFDQDSGFGICKECE